MTYPRKKPKPDRIKEVDRKVYERHRQWVRGHGCIVPDCMETKMQFCHVRRGLPNGHQAGMNQKPHDAFGFPACAEHHSQQHSMGELSFESHYGVDLLQTALGYAKQSPVQEIRELSKKLL